MTTVRLARAFRRLLKFAHTLGAAGFMGGALALIAMAGVARASAGGAGDPPLVGAMAEVAAWIVGPSMMLVVMSGLLSVAVTPAFHDVGWVWLKAGTGVLVLEGGLHVLGPLAEAAKPGAGALARAPDPASVTRLFTAEVNTLWVLLAVSAANVALGVWRPRLSLFAD